MLHFFPLSTCFRVHFFSFFVLFCFYSMIKKLTSFVLHFRIQLVDRNGNQYSIVDPTPNKHWEKLKAQKQSSTCSPGPSHAQDSDPTCVPHQGSYHQWGSLSDWGKSLHNLPALTRREIDLHVALVNMKTRPQKDSTRVSKPAIHVRGTHFNIQKYITSDFFFHPVR